MLRPLIKIFLLSATLTSSFAQTALIATPAPNAPPIVLPKSPSLPVSSYILVDDHGYELASKNPHKKLAPASLTKLMTLYVIFDALQRNQISLDDKVLVSNKAWHTGGSRMFLKPSSNVSVDKLIQGIIVESGNDACVAMAEYVSGSTDNFVALMNAQAKHLDMNDSHFDNVTGLPHSGHVSSAYDLSVLARSIHNTFPEYYHYFSKKWFSFNHIKQPNRNRLLWRDAHIDGMKTGHTDSAGYCLVSSENKNSMRLFSVVMGAKSDMERANTSQQLLNFGYHFFERHTLFEAKQTLVTPRIWKGKIRTAAMGLNTPLSVVIPRGHYRDLQANVAFNHDRLFAPIVKGNTYGKITLTLNGVPRKTIPLVALENDPVGNLWQRTRDWVLSWMSSSDKKGN